MMNAQSIKITAHPVNETVNETVNESGLRHTDHQARQGRTYTRDVRKRKDVLSPSIPSSTQDMEVDSCLEHRLATIDINSDINPGNKATVHKRSLADSAEEQSPDKKKRTEPSDSPAVNNALIASVEVPVKTALLQPYQPTSVLPHSLDIARPVHGLQHSCRTAVWALAILQLRRQQQDPKALAFPDDMVPLLIKACLFHDSGREGDGKDTPEWEQASGDNLAEHLRNSGMDQALAWQCREAVRHKDNPGACQHLPETIQTLRSLLREADTLDAMRVRSTFYMDRLESFSACQDDKSREAWRTLAKEVCQSIAGQGDLLYSITLQDDAASKGFFSIDSTYCDEKKKHWEHHPRPLAYQLQTISGESDYVRKLISPLTGNLVDQNPTFSIAKLHRQGEATGGCQIGKTGQYADPESHQRYYIKQATSHESACNQVLMANVARLFGLNVPDTFVHQEKGQSFVISEWLDDLEGGEEKLKQMSHDQWAKLLLINTIVGNEDIVNGGWQNIELTGQEEPVMFDWDWAGLANRYQRKNYSPDPKADDFSSMPVILKKLRDPQAPAMNSHPIENPCVDILNTLSDDQLGKTLKEILTGIDWPALDRLIEHSGFLAGDRSWLRQTLYDRIAWLCTRFPGSLQDGERVSMADYKAIEAAGIRGGWLQVKGKDIRKGQLCLTQLLDENNKPQTRMTLKLSRDAGNRLSDNLALERQLHRLHLQIQYFNGTRKDRYLDWRSDLAHLADECDGLAKQLTGDLQRWNPKDHSTITDTVAKLECIAEQGRASLAAETPAAYEKLPTINETLPVPAYPARVSSMLGTDIETKVQLAEYSHGFAKLTDQRVSYFDKKMLVWEDLTASPVRAIELQPAVNEQGLILFYPERLPNAQTFEHKLVLTFPGHGKAVVEALFKELEFLGIQAERPAVTDLEERWLDTLANYHGCLGDMNRAVAEASNADLPVTARKKAFLKSRLKLNDPQLDWELYCRTRGGRLILYRPGMSHGIITDPAARFCPVHNISFATTEHRGTGRVMNNILQNEGVLSSFERRTDIGQAPFGTDGGLLRQVKRDSGDKTFTRVQPFGQLTHSYYGGGPMSMQFKPSALLRMDACIFPGEDSFQGPYPGLDAAQRNTKINPQSIGEYQALINGDIGQETLYEHPLSLYDELSTLEMGYAEEQQQLLHALKRRYSHWPDGRPVERIFKHSWRACYYELSSENSPIPNNIKTLIEACGEDGIQSLLEQNPQLLEGKLEALDGLQILRGKLKNVDFRGCSMIGTLFKSTTFERCQFNTEQLDNAVAEDILFQKCSFEGKRFSPSVLENVLFTTNRCSFGPYNPDCLTPEHASQISPIIYRSCCIKKQPGNDDGIFNLEQWLAVMLKNNFLRDHKNKASQPLDASTREIFIQHIETIKKQHKNKLPAIIEGILGIEYESAESALTFINNNPQFYQHKVSDLGDLKYSHRNNPSHLKKIVPEKTIYAWLINCPESSLYSEGVEEDFHLKSQYIKKNYHKEYEQYARNLETKAKSCSQPVSLFNYFVYDALVYLVLNKRLDENSQSYWLKRFLESPTMRAKDDYRCHLERYRASFHNFWKHCSTKNKLEIARDCLKHGNTAISHLTTVEFIKLLIENNEGEKWMDAFNANIAKHRKSKYLNDLKFYLCNDIWGRNTKDINESINLFDKWKEKQGSLPTPHLDRQGQGM